MKSLWRDDDATRYSDPLSLRVYTSRLLGCEPSLVLHGGGNTSVKVMVHDVFGDDIETLYVKGSGQDLATIETAGFAPVRLGALRRMAGLQTLSDTDMVRAQRSSMLDPSAPNPSVEAILHALIPLTYVDHTHADAVVTITNTPEGESRIRDLYGDRVLVIPYVMPGFILAKTIHERTRNVDWSQMEGMVLLHHGVFTFSDDARKSYENMIRLVSEAEAYLETHAPVQTASVIAVEDLIGLARLRRAICTTRGEAMLAVPDTGDEAVAFSSNTAAIASVQHGTLTPDHVMRTKPAPMVVGDDVEVSVKIFMEQYRDYFSRHTDGALTCLDAAPRWAIWPGHGCLSFGRSLKETGIVADIVAHTRPSVLRAESMGGWKPVDEKDLFDIEYWELEQAKLKKSDGTLAHQGKVALVTGAASGIGKACVETLCGQGAAVAALDINPDITNMFPEQEVMSLICDVTDAVTLKAAVDATVRHFGGLDMVISNAGIFPPSRSIDEIDVETWDKSMAVNLTSHQRLIGFCQPYLALGVDPAIVIVASKNVPAPGPGAATYSVAKAGLTQLGRVAALEMAKKGIRVNMLHPNAVFDTAIWTDEVLAGRAAHYELSVAEYKTNNLLGVEVTSRHVAELAAAMASPLFACTTGSQLPVDGGNERVI